MTTTLAVPASYGYVLAVATASVLVNQWHGMRVGAYRKAAGVAFPNAYAPDAEASKSMEKYQFNCAQRAHANYLENYSSFLVMLLSSGIAHPEAAAGLGATWLVGRIMYATGYTRPQRDGGRGRYNGAIQYIGLLGLLGTSISTVYKLLA